VFCAAALRAAAGSQICSRATRNPTIRSSYLPLHKTVLLTCTKWIESHNAGDDGRGKRIDPVEIGLLAFLDLSATGQHLLGVLFVTGVKSNLCTALTTQNTIENNCITRTKHVFTSSRCAFNWDILVNGHK
jgi:hypothetical protein